MIEEILRRSLCRVKFHAAEHTYELDGRRLSGVTPVVKWLYPDTYSGIPERVLAQAAAAGTDVHDCIATRINTGMEFGEPTGRAAEFFRLTAEARMEAVAAEYLITDGARYASAVDAVCEGADGRCVLVDIKTTSARHECLWAVQLSIYAELFERQTSLDVGRLCVAWLPRPRYGQASLVDVGRLDGALVDEILREYPDGDASALVRKICLTY